MEAKKIYELIENRILAGNNIDTLKTLPDRSINCCITSPPYYGLRDYGTDEQIGLEPTPDEYIKRLVEVFREVKRVLKDDGTLWVVIADSYAGSGKSRVANPECVKNSLQRNNKGLIGKSAVTKTGRGDCKPKDLIGIPWMLAFALRADGWYLRQDLIWQKSNPMPESVTDRCTKNHEYIFLLSKSAKYYFNNKAIREPCSEANIKDFMKRKTLDNKGKGKSSYEEVRPDLCRSRNAYMPADFMRNKRSVWTVATECLKTEHHASFPQKLILPCILSGCPENGIVLDPFMGSGTTAVAAINNYRKYIGCELNKEYIKIAERRIKKETGLRNEY